MKKKGFTLVELLAVIVILAIVALVVVPTVMSVIKDARKKSAIESFRGYMDAVEKTIIRDSLKTTSELPEKDSNGCYSLKELDAKVKVKGDHPEIENEDKLCVENGKIKSISEVEMNGYALEYKDEDILLNGQAIEDKTIPEITIGSITATTNSITIPYEVRSGKSGVTVTCEYGTSESYGNNGTIQDNKCVLSGLQEETKYYFRLNSKTGKNKTANQASSAYTTCEYTVNQQFNFGYTGGVQTFSPKCSGRYKLEVWGAQGGQSTYGGKGAYATGNITFTKSSDIKVYVGGTGSGNTTSSNGAGGWNGGGDASVNRGSNYGTQYGGGGGTDIRVGGTSLQSRVIVAGGGGGGMLLNNSSWNSSFYYPATDGRTNSNGAASGGPYGGYAGGVGNAGHGTVWCCGGPGSGATTNQGGYGGGQWSNASSPGGAGSLGQGGNGSSSANYNGGAGGGGGYYGGGGSAGGCGGSTGGGGNSYVGGTTNGSAKAGNQTFASPSGSNETGHTGNGYARITYLGK